MYYYHTKKGLFPNSKKIHCESLVVKYINRNERLNDFLKTKFVANYDTRVNKKHNKSKIICWVSFNQHKNPKNHYRKLLFLFKPFQKSEFNLQNNCDS